MLKALARVVADAVVVAIVLFTTAGTIAWPHAWVLVSVLLIVRVVSAIVIYRANPALLEERATVLIHRDQPLSDRVVLILFMTTAFIGVPANAAIDVFHWHVLPGPPEIVQNTGLFMFVAGWFVTALALRENAFAVTVVRLQDERMHKVVDTGIYSRLRHPMYSGNPLILVGLSLWLGSYLAVFCAVLPVALLMIRIRLEERFLMRELPGYSDYSSRVRYRLVPGIW
jgi:protein-S-isoprenylcysteine O-methyltransferase Ste14